MLKFLNATIIFRSDICTGHNGGVVLQKVFHGIRFKVKKRLVIATIANFFVCGFTIFTTFVINLSQMIFLT